MLLHNEAMRHEAMRSLDRGNELSYKLAMTLLERNLNGSNWLRGRFLPRLPLG